MSKIELIRPGCPLSIDPVASGFAHGFGVFETIALRGGYLEFWDAHWRRFVASAESLGLRCEYEQEQVLSEVATLAKDLAGEGIIKLSLLKEREGAQLFVYARPSIFKVQDRVGFLIQEGFPINERSPLSGHKTHNYIESMMAVSLANEAGCYDLLRLNTQGALAEGAISNLFFVSKGRLKTPAVDTGLLPGVVRAAIVDKMDVKEAHFSLPDLVEAEAVFLTSSTMRLLPVDFVLHNGSRLELKTRDHAILGQVREVLSEKVEAARVQIFV